MLHWFPDPPDQTHADLARQIAERNWVTDGINNDEAQAVGLLGEIAAREVELARYLFGVPWMRGKIADDDIALLMWFRDNPVDWRGLSAHILSYDARNILRLVRLPWVMDGIDDDETDSLRYLQRIISLDAQLAGMVLESPWLARGGSGSYRYPLEDIIHVHSLGAELAYAIAASPWFSDAEHLTPQLYNSLSALRSVADSDRRLAQEVGRLLAGEPSDLDRHLARSLHLLLGEGQEPFEALIRQSWVADGLDDREKAFLVVTPDIARNSPDDYYQMLQTRHVRTSTIDLPLSGTVNLWAVQKAAFPVGDTTLSQFEDAVRYQEELMRAPFSTNDLVVIVVPSGLDSNFEVFDSNSLETPWPIGAFRHHYFRAPRFPGGELDLSVFYHELAHYYTAPFSLSWFLEGGAEFAADYVSYRTGAVSLSEWRERVEAEGRRGCHEHFRDLHALGQPGILYKASPHRICFYTMGNHLLSRLFLDLGAEATSRALSDIMSLEQSFVHRPTEERPLTGKDIYLAFQRHVAPDKEEALRNLFETLHGGPLANINMSAEDDYGDNLTEATELKAEVTVQGSLDHPLDVDYFRFITEEGEEFRIVLNHDLIIDNYVYGDLHVRLRSMDTETSQRLGARLGGTGPVQVLWMAPRSGEYYLSVESTTGLTGSYDLTIAPAAGIEDDHGDTATEATRITVGEPLEGSVDSDGDVDFFRFPVTSGYGYRVVVENVSLPHPRATVYLPDRATELLRPRGFRSALSSEILWRADDSAEYYVAVKNPTGDIGKYNLIVTEIPPGDDDHGDDAETATPLVFGEVVEATLNDSFDHDVFRFTAEAGETYNIKISHSSPVFVWAVLFAPDGVTSLRNHDNFSGFRGGSYLPWQASASGEYFLRLYRPDGVTGPYSVVMIRGIEESDDHGDMPDSATQLAIGSAIPGSLDHGNDFDYFRFEAEEGQRYEITLDYSGRSDRQVVLYQSDGISREPWYTDHGVNQNGSYVVWDAPRSGPHYALVFSPAGENGAYSLTVAAADRRGGQAG